MSASLSKAETRSLLAQCGLSFPSLWPLQGARRIKLSSWFVSVDSDHRT